MWTNLLLRATSSVFIFSFLLVFYVFMSLCLYSYLMFFLFFLFFQAFIFIFISLSIVNYFLFFHLCVVYYFIIYWYRYWARVFSVLKFLFFLCFSPALVITSVFAGRLIILAILCIIYYKALKSKGGLIQRRFFAFSFNTLIFNNQSVKN